MYDNIRNWYKKYSSEDDAADAMANRVNIFVEAVEQGLKKSDMYETRYDAFSELVRASTMCIMCPNETLREMVAENVEVLKEAMTEVRELIDEKGEGEKFRASGIVDRIRGLPESPYGRICIDPSMFDDLLKAITGMEQ